jgi:DNA-binding beta-propeller fold protein YncE
MPSHLLRAFPVILRAFPVIAAVFLVASGRAAQAQNELFVTNNGNDSVTVYSRSTSGNVAPLRALAGNATGLNGPIGVAVDTVNNELFVANDNTDSITVYPLTANGNVTPTRTIAGAGTGLSVPVGLTVDPVNNELIVANQGGAATSITVYARTANGNASPVRTIAGAATGLDRAQGLALDTVNGEIFVQNNGATITVYARTANGNAAPLRTLSGAATGFNNNAYGIAVDTVNNELVVADQINSILVFARTASGNTAPLRTISGAATGLNFPEDVAVDTVNNELVVANASGNSVTVYSRTASGNAAPLRTASGVATALNSPFFVAVTTGAPPAGAQLNTVTPCRLADTRDPVGPYGGPALAANADRTFVITTKCGIPPGARAVAFNFTITQPTGLGDLRVFPGGVGLPLVSVINWRPGQTRANNAVVSLGPSGDIVVHVDQASGTVHLIIDVNGYFQ